ncbi:hypothetical protein BSBH6_03686 [Bacillus subtilis]|nr:hypothetical protein BSBH6_03686 [Bacillus subtilis]RPK22425.1 hypothetical protein BH5_03690 [Bacillus subtilis]
MVRRFRRLLLKQLNNRFVFRIRCSFRVKLLNLRSSPLFRKKFVFRYLFLRLSRSIFKQTRKMVEQPVSRALFKQLCAIVQINLNALIGFSRLHRQIKFCNLEVGLMNRQRQITDSRNALCRILKTEHRVKQRMSAYITRDVQILYKPLKRIVLMRKGIQHLFANTRDQPGKRLVLLHFAANRERIDEHPDNALCIGVVSAR